MALQRRNNSRIVTWFGFEAIQRLKKSSVEGKASRGLAGC